MNTQQKIAAIIAAVKEHAEVYAAVKAPATEPAYNSEIGEGLRRGLVEKIANVFSDKVQGP
jgi:hypothetical protein